MVVGTHRRRIPADPSDVFVESCVHDALNGRYVGWTGPANLNVDHRADDIASIWLMEPLVLCERGRFTKTGRRFVAGS